MHQELPNFPPLFPPLEWWRIFVAEAFERMRQGDGTNLNSTFQSSVKRANTECGMRSRDWMRFRVSDDVTLSFPVAGGASALKNRHPDTWTLPREAVRETHKINSTLSTIFGRSPFFHLLKDDFMLPALPDLPVATLNQNMFGKVISILSLNDLSLYHTPLPSSSVVPRSSSSLPAYYSILPLIFLLGPDAIFHLLPAF